MNDGEDATERTDGPDDRADGPAEEPAEPDGEWRFTLEDIAERQAAAEEAEKAQKRRQKPIEPGNPSLEGTVFVLLGVAFALFIISRLFVG
jgi:hypothetical protein